MLKLDSLGRHIGQKIKSRGLEYFQRNSVSIVYIDSEFVSAEVRGSHTYDVDLERKNRTLIYSCSCPFFEDKFNVCKHIWATLLEMEKQGILKKWNQDFPEELIPAYLNPYEQQERNYKDSDFGHYSDSDNYGYGDVPDATLVDKTPSRQNWRHLLRKIHQTSTKTLENRPYPPGSEIIYIFEFSGQVPGSSPAIKLNIREPKKNGGWKKIKPFSFTHEILGIIPDEADQKILHHLAGVQRETWYRSPYESTARFTPSGRDLKALLPEISATGRLFFRAREADDIFPIQWDGKDAWKFQVEVLADPQGKQYEVSGTFHRGDRYIPVSLPEQLSKEGIFVMENTISFFDGPEEWISFFQDEGSFFFPESEAEQWLEAIYALPCIPPLNLPDTLRLEDIELQPKPMLQIFTRQKPWGMSYILGELYFDYDTKTIGESDTTNGFILSSERKRILRASKTEILARKKLEEVGFKRWKDYQNNECWTISKTHLPGAVQDLVAAEWHVEAEGRIFRNPGALKFQLASGIDWFELHGDVQYGETSIPVPRLLKAMNRKENTILLDDGSYGILPEEWLERHSMLLGLGTLKEDHVRFSRNQVGLLDTLLEEEPEANCDEAFLQLKKELQAFEGVDPVDPPKGFHGSLRHYQRGGLGWMHFLQRFRFGGCLADDMGLGKTIQVLALLEERRCLRAEKSSSHSMAPSLVVMPKSLVFNWLQEAKRFTPGLHILDHTGGERKRDHKHFDSYDVIFTTYGTLRRDASFFKKKTFDYIVLDEAQAIKNASTESAKAARLLKGRHRLALSGTPIENHIGELWSLFEFLNPGMLGSTSVFKSGKETQEKSGNGNLAHLARSLRPFVLRRTKKQVAPDLPDKVEQTLFCNLEPEQKDLYNELREHYRNSLLQRVESDGINRSKIYVLEALLRLRQAAIHPGLIDPSRAHEPSAKLDMLLPQLKGILDQGHKALVFSQFTSVLDILRTKLHSAGIEYAYLDGQTRDRAAPVERFQNDPEIKLFLISLKAGGLGLNLTAAEYVFLLDPWWNPAVEAQAIDRTHRIGQTRSVFAYRLIAKDTVEEKVLSLQETKREIADAIINQDNSLLRNLTSEDLALLLS